MVRRPTRRAYIGQWIFLAGVILVGWLMVSELGTNLARRNLHFGFGFLAEPAHFDIPFHLLPWTVFDLYAKALLVSFLNTLLVAAMGIVASTLLGLFVGIMRLSVNCLVRNIALAFVEFVRNTPQLIQIVFWYFAVLQTLPSPRQSITIPGGLLLNIRGLYVPDFVLDANGPLLSWAAFALVVATPFVWRLRLGHLRVGAKALILPLLALALFAAAIDDIEWPTLKGFNIAGGTQVPPELVALWAGLSIYAAGFIAEIVRGSIEAVPKGQSEAALALGLHPWQRLFLVVLPQALRIMVPQLTSQYLNLIKSTTLGAAVAYPEIFQIFAGTVMNQANKEVETILIVMAIFLAINLLTSAFMNWYNRHVALVER
ncbi:MAG: ABC transporter permease subunit [Alphaproteobacteria bacterium]|nr:ABC transporter permease subunit [Alphaproteobacteria bacterium]